MTIGIDQHKMRVGLFKPNRQQSKCYLNLYEVLCIGLIINTRNKKHALLAAVLISCLTEFNVENNLIVYTCKVDDFPKQNTNVLSYIINEYRFCFHQFLNIFFKAVIVFLLIIAGVETNPGPNPPTDLITDVLSSMSDLSITSSISAIFSSSISFLHLNIQSLVPKLDLITAEYADFDILSFSESWLNRSHTDESLKLSNYQTPFRNDRGPSKSGGGVILYVKDNINVSRRDDLEGILGSNKNKWQTDLIWNFLYPP